MFFAKTLQEYFAKLCNFLFIAGADTLDALFFFLSFFLFHFPTGFYALFSSVKTSASNWKLQHSVQNGLYSYSNISFWKSDLWSKKLEHFKMSAH